METIDDVLEASKEGGVLDLSHRGISIVSESVYSLGSVILVLNLSFNKLEDISGDIKFLVILEELNLESNLLTTLPTELEYLHRLKKLNLKSNKLSHVPEPVTKCLLLQELCLDNNSISLLTEEIANLKLLRVFSMKNNQLTTIPVELSKCLSLTTVDFEKNDNIDDIPRTCLSDTRVLLFMLGRFHLYEENLSELKSKIYECQEKLHACQTLKALKDIEAKILEQEVEGLSKLVPRRYLRVKSRIREFVEKLCCLRVKIFSEESFE